ncbi:MAG: PhoPQ-activated protein PqaA family protein [Balneolaceae bacterium]
MNQFRILILIIPVLFFSFCTSETETTHPFEAYLSKVDNVYEYELQHTIEGDEYTAYVVKMVSQQWLTEEIVDQPVWWHWLTIVVPDQVDHTEGLLWIGGGSTDTELPTEVGPLALQTALATNSVVADLHNIPFQPISFHEDTRLDERYEDEIIAYGWRKFLEGGALDEDAVWLSRFPMTKAAIRAMDTVTDFTLTELDLQVDQFVVAGGSKRGWTTWTTAIYDDRVIAIAPAVIDLLNMIPSFEHHWQAYGEWSPAIAEYEDEHIMDWQYSEEYARLKELVEPYSYLDRLTMPKFLINAASDEFFLPDSWQFYWEDLPGEKYMRYIPNTGHSLSETDAGTTLAAFHNHIIQDRNLPSFEWSKGNDGFQIQLDPENLPDELLLWNAHNPDGRDFRLYVIDRIWLAREIEISDSGMITVEISTPDSGYSAWFVEAAYNIDTVTPLKLTTGVVVTPDKYPFEPFQSENPLGTME